MFLPAGSQDEIGSNLYNRSKAYEIFTKVSIARNYMQISTPVVEYANTFINKHAGMNLQTMLKWFNREGEIEVLRPDWTTAIARALVRQHPSKQKWSYQGSVFRSDKDGIESRQAGIEIVHTQRFLGESECLLTAVNYLSELGINNYLIELGHTDIFEELTSKLALSDEQLEKLREAMHDKRKDEVYSIASSNLSVAEELIELVDAYGSVDVIEQYEEKWTGNDRLLSIINHLKQLATLLQDAGVKDVLVDLGRVKNLPYYDGTMFRGFLTSNGAICFSGGRYDKLYEQFGERRSAVGLAFDVDILADQINDQTSKEKICILASEETHVFAEKYRNQFENAIVDIQYELSDQHDYEKVLKVVNDKNDYKVVEL